MIKKVIILSLVVICFLALIPFPAYAGTDSDGLRVSRTSAIVVAANNSSALSKAQADYVCAGSNDQNTIATAISVAGSGGIAFSAGTYHLSAPVEFNVDNMRVETAGLATIFYADNGFTGNYLVRVSSSNAFQGYQYFMPMYIACNDRVGIGLQVENTSFNYFEFVRITGANAIGLYIYSHGTTLGLSQNHFSKISISNIGVSGSDLRGIVLLGDYTNTNGATCNYFDDVSIQMDNKTISYGIDFRDVCDNNVFDKVQLPGCNHLTAGIIFNSANPTSTGRFVVNNHINHFIYEPTSTTDIMVKSNVIDPITQPNVIGVISYNDALIAAMDEGLKIMSWRPSKYIHRESDNDALDPFYLTVATGGSIVLADSLVQLDSGNANLTSSAVRPCYYPIMPAYMSWNAPRKFSISYVPITATVNETDWMVTGYIGIGRHIGFKTIGGVIYGTVGNGTTETIVSTNTSAVAWSKRTLSFVYVPGVGAYFSVDGVYKAAITTNLPTGDVNSNVELYAAIVASNGEMHNKFGFANYRFEQL